MAWDVKEKKVVYTHNCEACQTYGYPEMFEECTMCGYKGEDIQEKLRLSERFNKAYQTVYGDN